MEVRRIEVTVSWGTLLKIFLAVVLAWAVYKLSPLLVLLFVALLIAVTLHPIPAWTERRGWPKWVGIVISALLLAGFVGVTFGILIPTVTTQASTVAQALPKFKAELIQRLPASGLGRAAVDQLFGASSFKNPEPLLKKLVEWGRVALDGLAGFLVVLVVAVFFLADGHRVYQWLLAFLPELHRRKVATASEEMASVVSSYMMGQLITSVLCAVYVFIILTFLHVPNAALLGVLAGIFDILPLIGFFLSVLPAIAVAVTVSPTAAILTAVLYLVYHLVESYFIVPKVYGNQLRLSTLTVLVSCMAAALVAGVVGAIVILPIVACYPIVERIWLRPYLERDTVRKHEEIDRSAE